MISERSYRVGIPYLMTIHPGRMQRKSLSLHEYNLSGDASDPYHGILQTGRPEENKRYTLSM